MNVIFIEPSFPYNQREFVRALHAAGANVIGIGERPESSTGRCQPSVQNSLWEELLRPHRR